MKMCRELDTYHDYCDGEENPPTAELSAMFRLVATIHVKSTYNKAGSLWIVWTTGCPIVQRTDELRVMGRMLGGGGR